MKLIIHKIHKIAGKVAPPSSKSQTIRALFLATLANGESLLKNPLFCDDTESAIRVCQGLGAVITKIENDNLKIIGSSLPLNVSDKVVNSGSSGITTNFSLPLFGLRKNTPEPVILDCSEQMKQRPTASLVLALRNLGMQIEFLEKNNRCPLSITGKLLGGEARVSGMTSQFMSALLLSLPLAKQDSSILVEDLHERPYLEMTKTLLKEQKIIFKHLSGNGFDVFKIKGGQRYLPFQKTIPVDFSSASYLIVAGVLLPGQVEFNNIDMNDCQGDKKMVDLLLQMGADITIDGKKMLINGGKNLHGIKIDANEIPDLVPTLAVVATQVEGCTEIYNVVHARDKETDRIRSMSAGLGAMGAYVEEKGDGLIIRKSGLRGAEVNGYDDHRTVMALAVAGLLAEGETIISTAEAISKTFPNFVQLMNILGADIKII